MKGFKLERDKHVFLFTGDEEKTAFYHFSLRQVGLVVEAWKYNISVDKFLHQFLKDYTVKRNEIIQLPAQKFYTELDQYLSEAIDFLNDEVGSVWEALEEEDKE